MKKIKKKKKKDKRKFLIKKKICNKFWIPKLKLHKVNVRSNAWFNINKFIDDNASHFNLDIPSDEDDDIDFYKSIKIKLTPTPLQRKILYNWIKIYKYVYNYGLYYIRTTDKTYSFYKLRSLLKNQLLNKQHVNTSKIPSHIIDEALHDLVKAFKTAFENLKRGNIKHFKIRYKKNSKNIESICISGEYFSKKYNTFCKKVFGKHIETSKSIIGITKTSRLTFNKSTNEFYLYVPEKIEERELIKNNKIISLDPGVRTFVTGYTNDKHILEIGTNVYKKIKMYHKKIDKINDRKKSAKTERRIQNLVDDLHWKTIKYLCKNYKTVILGEICTQSILRGKLHGMTKRVLQSLSHYKFHQRLNYKSKLNKTIYKRVREDYTSKTCGKCGNIDKNLGGKKVYNCKKCGIKIDRDVNGSRNILLKNFVCDSY